MTTRHRQGDRRTTFVPQLGRFAIVSAITALLHAAVFLLARTWCDPFTANLLAVVLSMTASTEMHRRLTFRNPALGGRRLHIQTGIAILYYSFANSGVLLLLRALSDSTDPVEESLVLGCAGFAAAALRFLILRRWVLRPDPGTRAR